MGKTKFKDLNQLLGRGLYTVTEAARLTSVNSSRIRRWLSGYSYGKKEDKRASAPVWNHELPAICDQLVLSFLDLMEVRFVDAFRQHGVSFPTIRKAACKAAKLCHSNHPFSTMKFKTDGRTIFAELATEVNDKSLLDLKNNQYAFQKILKPYLYEGLEFSPDKQVDLWRPPAGHKQIVLDPRRSFGKPILDKEGVPTAVLANAFHAEQSIKRVADIYEVSPGTVKVAVEFERQMAA